jgi:hypothetical protein
MDKYRVTLEAEERTALEKLVSTGKSASRKLTHARILLLAEGERGVGHTDDDIVEALCVSPKTISRVRRRFVTEGVDAAIDPRPQPARPDKIKIKGDVEQRLVILRAGRDATFPSAQSFDTLWPLSGNGVWPHLSNELGRASWLGFACS